MLIPPSPDILVWEKEYFSFYVSAIIGLLMHGYDTWYWWHGQSLMLRTPGNQKTVGLFIYFGQQDLFGWIKYPVKIYLVYFITTMMRMMVAHFYYRRLEKRLNKEVPPARFKIMCENWQRELDASMTTKPVTAEGMLLSPPAHSRQPSINSLRSQTSIKPRLSINSRTDHPKSTGAESWNDFDEKKNSVDGTSSPEVLSFKY